jgi:prolyl oligopeptidase
MISGRHWLRAGGECGPQWYRQTVREGRHLVAEDFAAVARDLGAIGSSAGGRLMGVMLAASRCSTCTASPTWAQRCSSPSKEIPAIPTTELEGAGDQVVFYERADGGHGTATTTSQAAFLAALTYEFVHRVLNSEWSAG